MKNMIRLATLPAKLKPNPIHPCLQLCLQQRSRRPKASLAKAETRIDLTWFLFTPFRVGKAEGSAKLEAGSRRPEPTSLNRSYLQPRISSLRSGPKAAQCLNFSKPPKSSFAGFFQNRILNTHKGMAKGRLQTGPGI